jgi:hypothetical protein
MTRTNGSNVRIEDFRTDIEPGEAAERIARHVRAVAMQMYLVDVPAFLHMRQLTEYLQGRRYMAPDEAPLGGWVLMRELADPTTTTVSPNVDTLYGAAYVLLDRHGPVVLTVPPIVDRYASVTLLDAYFDNFHIVGTSAGDTGGVHVLIVPAGWSGDVPAGIDRVVTAPTPSVCLIQRIYTSGPHEYDHLHALQDAIVLSPLSRWVQDDSTFPGTDLAEFDITDMRGTTDPLEFFDLMRRYTADNPPPGALAGIAAIGAAVGVGPGANLPDDPALVAAIVAGARDAQAAIDATLSTSTTRGGWTVPDPTAGTDSPDVLRRAAVQLTQMGLLPLREATYYFAYVDEHGEGLHGAQEYELRFAPGDLPPSRALGFWSITLYDERSLLVENPIDRYVIRPDTSGLTTDADGGLTIRVSAAAPDGDPSVTWLPAPPGPFTLALRIYLPTEAVLTGEWIAPPICRTTTGVPR